MWNFTNCVPVRIYHVTKYSVLARLVLASAAAGAHMDGTGQQKYPQDNVYMYIWKSDKIPKDSYSKTTEKKRKKFIPRWNNFFL
jgi:hypothetical protein